MSYSLIKKRNHLFLFLGFTLLFWWIRVAYWARTNEIPFSDMNDYLMVSHNILDNFFFGMDEFWKSYKPPGLPVFGAIVFSIFGRDNFTAYRIILSLLTYVSVIVLSQQIYNITKKYWISFLLLFTVAISKSSIFWSYKFSSEGLAEALFYLTAAVSMSILKNTKLSKWFIIGLLFAASALNRPQYAIIVPVFLLTYIVSLRYTSQNNNLIKILPSLFVMGLGMTILWGPWLVRTYNIYGHPMIGNTSTPFNFLFELGPVKLIENSKVIETKECMEFLQEARQRFPSDYQAQIHGMRFVKSWLKENFSEYLKIIFNFRIKESLFTYNVHLTKVSRHHLFDNPIDNLLPDRNAFIVTAGFFSLIALGLVYPIIQVLPLFIFSSWSFSILFLSTARLIEPIVPLLIFAFFCSLVYVVKTFYRKFIG